MRCPLNVSQNRDELYMQHRERCHNRIDISDFFHALVIESALHCYESSHFSIFLFVSRNIYWFSQTPLICLLLILRSCVQKLCKIFCLPMFTYVTCWSICFLCSLTCQCHCMVASLRCYPCVLVLNFSRPHLKLQDLCTSSV